MAEVETNGILKIQMSSEIFTPINQITIRPDEHPWIACQIRNLIRKRKRTFRKYKKTQNLLFWEKSKMLRNQINSKITSSKKNYFDKLEDILLSTPKYLGKTSKQVIGLQKSNHTIPTLKLNDKFAENDIDKANMLNDYFCSQAVVNDNNKLLPLQAFTYNSRLNSISISQQDVRDVLNNINVTKACGPDLISPRLLNEGATILSKPLSIIFNRSLLQGYFLSSWKDAYATGIYKKAGKSMPLNYRPISLLSQIRKAMERCIHKHLYNYISEKKPSYTFSVWFYSMCLYNLPAFTHTILT